MKRSEFEDLLTKMRAHGDQLRATCRQLLEKSPKLFAMLNEYVFDEMVDARNQALDGKPTIEGLTFLYAYVQMIEVADSAATDLLDEMVKSGALDP